MVHFSIKISFYPVALLGMLEAIAMRPLQPKHAVKTDTQCRIPGHTDLILPDPFVSLGKKGGIEDGSIVCPDYQEIEIDP